MAKRKSRAMLRHDSKFTQRRLLILVALGDEPAHPGFPEENPVQSKSSPKAKELIACSQETCSGGWQAFSKCVADKLQGKTAAELIDPSTLVALWIGISILNFTH